MKWHILSRFGLELGLGTRLEDLSSFIRLTYPPSPSSIYQSITSLSVSRFLLVQSARATCGARVQVGSKDETRLFAGCWLELHHHSIYFWTMDGEREDKEQLLSHRGRKGSVCCHGHGHEMRCMRTSTRVVAFEHSQSGHTERLERLRMNKSRGFCNLVWFVTSTPLDDPRKSLFPHFHFACFWVLGCLAASVGHQIQKKRRPFIRARLFLGFDIDIFAPCAVPIIISLCPRMRPDHVCSTCHDRVVSILYCMIPSSLNQCSMFISYFVHNFRFCDRWELLPDRD